LPRNKGGTRAVEPKVLLIATLDTKEKEAAYLKRIIEAKGVKTLVMDTGVLAPPRALVPDVSREEVALAGGDAHRPVGGHRQ